MYSLNFSSSLNPNLSNLYSFDLCEVSFQQRRNDSLYNYANFSVADAITKIPGLESTVKTLKAEIEKLCSLNVNLEGSVSL